MTHPTEDQLLTDLIKTNRRTEGETISREQHMEEGEYNPWQVESYFGSWNEGKKTAGVYRESPDLRQMSDEDILRDMKRVNNEVEGHLQVEDYKERGEYGISTIYNRFESFKKARNKAYVRSYGDS